MPRNEPSAAQNARIDQLACAALRGEMPAWTLADHPSAFQAFIQRAADHGIQVLLHTRSGGLDWPVPVMDFLRGQALGWAAWENRHREHVQRALAALAAKHIPAVVFKGTALAYTTYAQPHLRPRADTDLLVPAARRADAADAFRRAGFRQDGSVDPEFVSYEASFRCDDASGGHTLDMHWRIHYSQMQARLLPFEELHSHATGIPAFDNNARCPSRVHSILITCLHRANDLRYPLWHQGVVHFGADRLIWLHDLHLLMGELSEDESADLVRIASRKGLWGVCADALRSTVEAFGTRLPPAIETELRVEGDDALRAYHESSTLQQKWTDVRALSGWRARASFTLEHLLPPASYMRGRYQGDTAPLRVLHARRIMDGLRRRSAAGSA